MKAFRAYLRSTQIAWSLRKVIWKIKAIKRGSFYGIERPGWWPRKYIWNLGPQSDHAGKAVTIFVSGKRYEFRPVMFQRYQGHMHRGELVASTEIIASRMQTYQIPIHIAPIMATISAFEGGFDAIQTYDRAKFSWGFIQFAASGGLPGLLSMIKTKRPDLFELHFQSGGISIENGKIIISRGESTFHGMQAINRLHDDPKLWKYFLISSQDPDIQAVQILAAYENYYQRILRQTITLGSQAYAFGDLFSNSEYGRAILYNLAVHRGLVYTSRLFKQAAKISRIQSPGDAELILSAARQMEKKNSHRWASIMNTFGHSQ